VLDFACDIALDEPSFSRIDTRKRAIKSAEGSARG
jgi:hypothetical protein